VSRLSRAIWPLALAAPLLLGAGKASAATGSCDGVPGQVRNARVVRGGPGNDVLMGGPRSQTISGGGGDDLICAGDGNDAVHGGPGNDTIHGEGRGDRLFGDAGDDRLYGDVLDDRVIGGGGNDTLIGGQGVDRMLGGSGNDLMRGGVNRDCYDGGGGLNTASFATATPPGPTPQLTGVSVDLNRPASAPGCFRGGGSALGDGNDSADPEPLKNIQFVVGSAFADSCAGIAANSTADCGDESQPGTSVLNPVTPAPPDPGLVIIGGAADDTIDVGPPGGPLGYVLVYGGDGNDTVNVGEGLPPDATVDVDGGPGNDTINGGSLGDVLIGGDGPGADALSGNGGDDAVISKGGGPAAGPDTLSGGDGDDQLVADYPCAGDTFSGGSGDDVAGFAQSTVGIRARLGGQATLASGGCPAGSPTTILSDNEVLEGTNEADRLFGSPRPETIWGREGKDTIVGEGGADDLEGFAGADFINARDGRRDRLIDCGSGRDRARLDRSDPKPISC
jgi:Ca2+-binding RTX toxin-like protein